MAYVENDPAFEAVLGASVLDVDLDYLPWSSPVRRVARYGPDTEAKRSYAMPAARFDEIAAELEKRLPAESGFEASPDPAVSAWVAAGWGVDVAGPLRAVLDELGIEP